MRLSIITGALTALFTGIAIGTQSTITSRAGSIIGDVRTGLLTNFLGGMIAAILVLLFYLKEGPTVWKIPWIVVGFVAISGFLGILIITGISFSLQRVGIAAGLGTVIIGQLVLSFFIDSFGIGGVEPIPLTLQRVVGLLTTGFGVFLLLPRS